MSFESVVLTQLPIYSLVYGFLDHRSRKALSASCRSARRDFLLLYYPGGFKPSPATICFEEDQPQRSRCKAVMCGRTSSPRIQELGLIAPRCLGLLFCCGRAGCRDNVMRSSFDRAVAMLAMDEGQGYYVHPAVYSRLVAQAKAIASHGGTWTKETTRAVRALHSEIIWEVFRHTVTGASCSAEGIAEATKGGLLVPPPDGICVEIKKL